MDMLKKFFPFAFKSNDLTKFIIALVIFVLIGAVGAAVIGVAATILGAIPLVGGILVWAVGVIGSVVGLYSLVGIVLSILVFVKVIK